MITLNRTQFTTNKEVIAWVSVVLVVLVNVVMLA